MTLRTKLTLGSVALETVLVTIILAVGLGNLMQVEFRNTLERAEIVKQSATDAVIDALNRQHTVELAQATRDPTLNRQLSDAMSSYKGVSDIMLVSAETNMVLA